MKLIRDLLKQGKTNSFEFFPPKTPAGQDNLDNALKGLAPLNPDFMSVTYGAGGSTREGTLDNVVKMQSEFGVPVMAHLTCVGHRRDEITQIMDSYAENGISNLLALGGDPPRDGSEVAGDFEFATDLIEQIRSHGDWSIGAAAHPEGHPRSADLSRDREWLAHKLNQVDFAITQFFFKPEHWIDLVEDLARRGCDTPVVPGIMPVRDVGALERMSKMAGATIPKDMYQSLDSVRDSPEDVAKIGIEIAVGLAKSLIDAGAPGLHFYCLNRSEAAVAIFDQIG